MNQYYFIYGIDELRSAVKTKNDYQLIREFTLWGIKESKDGLKVMASEMQQRKYILLKIVLIALFTNTIEFLNEIVNIERNTYFEDRSNIIFRRCILGVVKLLLLPVLTIGYLFNGDIWYGIYFPILIFFIGIVLTINDIIKYKKVLM